MTTAFDDDDFLDGVELDSIEPTLLEFDAGRAAQKARYGGELFPADWDAMGNSTSFLEFFQAIRGGGQKGIIRIDLHTFDQRTFDQQGVKP